MLFNVLYYRTLVTTVLCSILTSHGALGKKSITGSAHTTISSCPSQTINYITATLPQQCLRTSWSSDHVPGGDKRQAGSSDIPEPLTPTGATHRSETQPIQHSISTITTQHDGSQSQTPIVTTSADTIPISVQEPAESNLENDTDPLSDNGNFLSFEEWKAQMLQKAGQSPEHVAGPRVNQKGDTRRRSSGINNALDSYGEEGEIEIEFGGFSQEDPGETLSAPGVSSSTSQDGRAEVERPRKRSKEAGTTSKERFNYASFDCAATVLKTNKGSKGDKYILLENKDSYMLSACSVKEKFVIVELCNDILIDTIVLGNFEFFSSTFKTFRVSMSDRYPVKTGKWREVGTFEARNTRGIQAFLVEHEPDQKFWARYLRIDFLSHYGNEYYCPVSLLRVHGKTMLEDFKAASEGQEDEVDEEIDEEQRTEKVLAEALKDHGSATDSIETLKQQSESNQSTTSDLIEYSFYDERCPRVSMAGPLVEQTELLSSRCRSHWKFCNMAKVKKINYTSITSGKLKDKVTETLHAQSDRVDVEKGRKIQMPEAIQANKKAPSTSVQGVKPSQPASGESQRSIQTIKTSVVGSPTAARSSTKPSTRQSDSTASTRSHTEQQTISASKSAGHAPVSAQFTQESFFTSVHKRLQQLEANSTLSLQYIEEQSRILREAFTKVEKRQLTKTSSFLETLNNTVLSELREFRLQYDQIWQSTVLELSAQREQSLREVTALSQRLTLLADEVLWQKRLVIVQFGLIMLCLALVVFSRNQAGNAAYLDIPLLQNMVSKPSASFARYLNLESPPGTPSRPSSRYERLARNWTHFRSPSHDTISSDDGMKAPNIEYQLPTPSSEIDDPVMDSSSPEGEHSLRRAQSTPILGKESDDLLEPASETEPDVDFSTNESAREALDFLDT
jgi:hypothetical protein